MIFAILILSFFLPKPERITNPDKGEGKGLEQIKYFGKKDIPLNSSFTITVRIFHFFSNEGDEWDGQDTYYKITIDDGYINSTFQTGIVANNNNDYDCEITYSRVVYDTVVNIRIEVWDSDFWSADDELNIGGTGSDKSCDLTYNVNQKKWWGDTDSLWIRGNSSEYSAIWFYIQADPDNETPGRYRFDDTLFHSCGLLSGISMDKKNSIMALSNFWDEYYTYLITDTIYNNFLSFTDYFSITSGTSDSAHFDIFLYHPSESLIASSTNPDTITEFIEISQSDTGKYFLEFLRTGASGWIKNFYYRISDKFFLTKDTVFKGFLVYDFQGVNYYDWKDEYLFYKKNTENVTIELIPSISLDADLFLFDSSGNLISSSENTGYGVPEDITLSNGEGYYYFLVYQKEGNGIYQINFQKLLKITEILPSPKRAKRKEKLILDVCGRKLRWQKKGILFIRTPKGIKKLIRIDLKNRVFVGYNF